MAERLYHYESMRDGQKHRDLWLYGDFHTIERVDVPDVITIEESKDINNLIHQMGQFCRRYNLDGLRFIKE